MSLRGPPIDTQAPGWSVCPRLCVHDNRPGIPKVATLRPTDRPTDRPTVCAQWPNVSVCVWLVVRTAPPPPSAYRKCCDCFFLSLILRPPPGSEAARSTRSRSPCPGSSPRRARCTTWNSSPCTWPAPAPGPVGEARRGCSGFIHPEANSQGGQRRHLGRVPAGRGQRAEGRAKGR